MACCVYSNLSTGCQNEKVKVYTVKNQFTLYPHYSAHLCPTRSTSVKPCFQHKPLKERGRRKKPQEKLMVV